MLTKFNHDNRIFIADTNQVGPHIIAESPPILPHLEGEKQDAVFNAENGKLIAGPFGSGYRIKLGLNERGEYYAQPYHWFNGKTDHSYLLTLPEQAQE